MKRYKYYNGDPMELWIVEVLNQQKKEKESVLRTITKKMV